MPGGISPVTLATSTTRTALIAHLSGTVHRVVLLTGLDTRLPTFTTLSQAL